MTNALAADEEHARGDDRRADFRIPIRTEVSLASDSQFFTALTGNLSMGGVFVATYQPVAIGAAVSLHIALPDGDLHVTGVVRWIREASSGALPGLGVAFDSLDEAGAQRIADFCAMREPLLHDE